MPAFAGMTVLMNSNRIPQASSSAPQQQVRELCQEKSHIDTARTDRKCFLPSRSWWVRYLTDAELFRLWHYEAISKA